MEQSATTYRLVSIDRGSGQCAHCRRNLRRLCTIEANGERIVVGIDCCKELTGWTPDAARLRRQMREDAARAQFGDLFDRAMSLRFDSMGRFAVDLMLEGQEWSYYLDEKLTVAEIVDRAETKMAA